uniref:Nucleoporin SEH1 n=1 Tax=Tetraselmis sp. GSL018 TaxID=582737 RepID=A0A061SB81_9CHLO|eukprot:CAMPEP_0177587624 /NCGR_PEP_ID=MMETSP0419_2-20121207/5762_1 /TAXON_ID=582737 /ORGANISM="Tetraselmis sp., Strain GSL018" /LENGTH=322 /DNA_ID=CAMNT_0019077709 /DNA_START=339 /DNA_END=1307 /DNA_ORIENTATION=-
MAEALNITSKPIEVEGSILSASYNQHGNLLACCTADGLIRVYTNEKGEDLALRVTIKAGVPTGEGEFRLAWAHPEFGNVLAASFGGQALGVWEELPGQDGPEWRRAALLSDSRAAVRDVSFVPKDFGLQLAAAFADGTARIYEPLAPFGAEEWALVSTLRAVSDAACTCLAWQRPPANGPLPLLAAGGSKGGVAVWRRVEAVMDWHHCTTFAAGATAGVSCMHWAPALGRPQELLAVGSASAVEVWSLTGTADSSMQAEMVARLDAGASVWKVEWNMLGTALAVSTEAREVLIFTPTLLGEFNLTAKFAGDAAMAPGAAMDH